MAQKIVFFDGFCHLCNHFVEAILLRRQRHNLFVASLQGQTAKNILPNTLVTDPTTVVYFDGHKVWIKSEAALKIIIEWGGPWHLMSVFWILPTPFRDMIYDFVAHNRYKFFGRRETCRVASAEERERFLP